MSRYSLKSAMMNVLYAAIVLAGVLWLMRVAGLLG
jgi:hypothetical protein